MKLYLQMGSGMMTPAKELIEKWGEGSVILSPRDLSHDQMVSFSSSIIALGGEVLCDPQFYLPRADHVGLTTQLYWPKSYSTSEFNGQQMGSMLETLWNEYCEKLNASTFILPGCYAKSIDDEWLQFHASIVSSAAKYTSRPRYATLCLSADVLKSEEQIHRLLEQVEQWEVSGYYVVPEHDGVYFSDDPLWQLNLMDLCAGLKLQNRSVIVGYSNQQNLCLSLAKVDGIASGTFVNVRKFPLSKFQARDDDSQSRRKPWYYSPQALSEFQVSYLDMAQRGGLLELLRADSSFDSGYGEILFSGAKPTDTEFKEKRAFRHYLQCLKVQADLSTRSTYKETYDAHLSQLNAAEKILQECHRKGVFGKYRDFSEIVDVNRSAASLFNEIRGFAMGMSW